MQCFNCQQYGHKAPSCKEAPKCKKCAGDHNSRDCKSESAVPKCINCNLNHESNHPSCPARVTAKDAILADQLSYAAAAKTDIPETVRLAATVTEIVLTLLESELGRQVDNNKINSIVSAAFSHHYKVKISTATLSRVISRSRASSLRMGYRTPSINLLVAGTSKI